LDQVRDRIRRKHYSIRTEQAYVDWILRFVLHHNKRRPRDMGAAELEAFLTHLAVAKRVSASTQNQAKSAVLFLYKEVLGKPLPWLEGIESAKRPARLPVVLTREEVESIFAHLGGTVGSMMRLLYGTGMRLMECVRLRVKDVDFARCEIQVRQGKDGKDRMTVRRPSQPRSRRTSVRSGSFTKQIWKPATPRSISPMPLPASIQPRHGSGHRSRGPL